MRNIKNESQDHKKEFRCGGLSTCRGDCHRIERPLFLPLIFLVFSVYVGATYAEQESKLEQEVRNARGLAMAEAGQAVYTGEFFRVGERKVQLLRSLEKVAIRYLPSENLFVMNHLQEFVTPQGELIVEHDISEHGITILQTPKLESLDALDDSIRQLEQTPGIVRVVPVYIHEESGLQLIPTDELVVKLAAGADLVVLQTINNALGGMMVRPLWGITDQFIVAIPDCTPEELLSTCEIYWQDPAIEWAHPDFLCETVEYAITPNDTLYLDQWYLNNTGQSGGRYDADIDAAEAWEATTEKSEIVIAIIDDGMDLTHEDLKDNLWCNSLEIANNGVDDDDNGYVDDINGWNFHNDTKDPIHGGSHYHGTLVAGVAAARGNNNKGVAGCALGCRLMPLRVSESENPFIRLSREADAVHYAAGFTKNGQGRWRGADVINISRGYGDLPVISSALDDAATKGRNGKGCPIFCATGNSGSNYVPVVFETGNLPEGTYQIEFVYYKDTTDTSGEDAVWIADVVLPDSSGTHERFDAPTMPSGWSRAGNIGFSIVDDPAHSYGTGRYVARSGRIGNNQKSILRTRSFQLVPGNYLTFKAWISTEKGSDSIPSYPPSGNDGDWLFVKFLKSDGGSWRGEVNAGTPGDHWPLGYWHNNQEDKPISTRISFPASHRHTIAVGASTDFDYRAGYSQYGTGLDFVAPSGGGSGDIWTTDRTGDAGANTDPNGHYYSFSGTSASSPLAAGVAALILSKNPDLTAAEVYQIIRESCDKIGEVTYDENGWNEYYGYGRINARVALGVKDSERNEIKLTASDGASGDSFGSSVAISGDYVIVGASSDDDNGDNSGSAYIFKRSGSGWTEQKKLTALDSAKQDCFGLCVAISGDYAIVAAPGDSDQKGSAYIFKRAGTNWIQQKKLTASGGAANNCFGQSVSIRGDYAIVGAPNDARQQGYAYIFKRQGTNWIQQNKLMAWIEEPILFISDKFGQAVAIDGDYAVVGGSHLSYSSPFDEIRSGSVYIFKGTDNWTSKKILDGPRGARFSDSVAISRDFVVVGAPGDDDNGTDSGSADVFRLSQAGN